MASAFAFSLVSLPTAVGAVDLAEATAAEEPKLAEKAPVDELTADAARVADWIVASSDNGSLPYIIIDKQAAALFLFDAKGKSLGKTPVLIGVALGDDATPGIGSKNLAQIGPAERTTPAGRYYAQYGRAVGTQRMLWVDYATSVGLHPLVPGTKKERRRARLASARTSDNRITFGCINVPPRFYSNKVYPLFRRKGGMVYILPDTKPMEEVFPRLRVQPFLTSKPQEP